MQLYCSGKQHAHVQLLANQMQGWARWDEVCWGPSPPICTWYSVHACVLEEHTSCCALGVVGCGRGVRCAAAGHAAWGRRLLNLLPYQLLYIWVSQLQAERTGPTRCMLPGFVYEAPFACGVLSRRRES
jgi:hypothetical protein